MALASSIEDRDLLGAGGVTLGTVRRLLFHPSEACIVGAMVRPPRALIVVARHETYLPLTSMRFDGDGTVTELAKLPRARKGAEGLGFDPETTVIWTGMPVVSPTDRVVGTVSDVDFDPVSGRVKMVEVAAGLVADTTHGRYVVPGARVRGFADGAVRIEAEAVDLEASGGLAKAAAGTFIAASETVAALGESVGNAVVGASAAAGRAIKAVADAKVAEKTVKRVKNTWRDSVKAFHDGMRDDE